MKRILLLRHAKSSWGDDGLDDHDRALAARGERAAGLVGEPPRTTGSAPRPRAVLERAPCAADLGARARAASRAVAPTRRAGSLPGRRRVRSSNGSTGSRTASRSRCSWVTIRAWGTWPWRCPARETPGRWSGMRAKFPTAALAVIDAEIPGWKDPRPGGLPAGLVHDPQGPGLSGIRPGNAGMHPRKRRPHATFPWRPPARDRRQSAGPPGAAGLPDAPTPRFDLREGPRMASVSEEPQASTAPVGDALGGRLGADRLEDLLIEAVSLARLGEPVPARRLRTRRASSRSRRSASGSRCAPRACATRRPLARWAPWDASPRGARPRPGWPASARPS